MYRFISATIFSFILLNSIGQTQFENAYKEGFDKGYCQQNDLKGIPCYPPSPQRMSISVNAQNMNDIQAGYNHGFQKGTQVWDYEEQQKQQQQYQQQQLQQNQQQRINNYQQQKSAEDQAREKQRIERQQQYQQYQLQQQQLQQQQLQQQKVSANALSDEQLISVFSTGEKVERTLRNANPNTSVVGEKSSKKKKSKK